MIPVLGVVFSSFFLRSSIKIYGNTQVDFKETTLIGIGLDAWGFHAPYVLLLQPINSKTENPGNYIQILNGIIVEKTVLAL